MLRHLPSIPTHPLLVVCLLGNSLLKFTPIIRRELSFYYPDCNKEVCLVIASELLQCITVFSYRELLQCITHHVCDLVRLVC